MGVQLFVTMMLVSRLYGIHRRKFVVTTGISDFSDTKALNLWERNYEFCAPSFKQVVPPRFWAWMLRAETFLSPTNYSKTPWDAAPWHTIFADTLFWFRSKNFRGTLSLGLFSNPKIHCSANLKLGVFLPHFSHFIQKHTYISLLSTSTIYNSLSI